MSEMELWAGKIKAIPRGASCSLEDQCEFICKKHGFDLSEYYDTWVECLRDNGYNHYHIHNDTVYDLSDLEELDPYGVESAVKNKDGSISVILHWYNGGAGMDEVLDSALKKME